MDTILIYSNRKRGVISKSGFTVVELLIVIVVVAILATITIISYRGVTQQAREASLLSAVKAGADELKLAAVDTKGVYPANLAEADLTKQKGVTYFYQRAASTKGYCLTVSIDDVHYFQTNESEKPARGTCEGLIAWWPLNGSAYDYSGNGINGTVNGATPTTGQNGKQDGALSLGITAQNVTIGNAPELSTVPQAFTYSIWVSRTGVSTSQWPVIMGANSSHTAFALRTNTYGQVVYFEYGTSPFAGATYTSIGANLSLSAANEWHLATITYNGTTLRAYYDGVFKGEKNAAVYPTMVDLYLGTPTGGWVGNIDDARIYTRALSAAEVKELYDAGAL